MNKVLIKNANIVNEGQIFQGDVYIEGEVIVEVASQISAKSADVSVYDA
jgi:dihydroorotase